MSLRLSEAIRLGSMLRPQAFRVDTDGVGTCAFGAAKEAIGVDVHSIDWDISRIFPIVDLLPGECPVCGENEDIRASIISEHLNDEHRWTRERIADYVESVEREIEAKQQPADSLVDEVLVAK